MDQEILEEPNRTSKIDHLDDIDVEAILARGRAARPRRFLYEAPEFVKRLSAFEEVRVGEAVIFECQWKALPKPAIKWYKDDEEITENPRYQIQCDEGLARLSIDNAQRCDEGAYKCKAENQEGVASTTGYFSVTGENKYDNQSPRKVPERTVSLPPHLRTIVEQKSLEDREEKECSSLPRSPIQDFIDQFSGKSRTWPYARLGQYSGWGQPDESNDDSGSETSVDSQDYENVSFEVKSDLDPEVFEEGQPLIEPTGHLPDLLDDINTLCNQTEEQNNHFENHKNKNDNQAEVKKKDHTNQVIQNDSDNRIRCQVMQRPLTLFRTTAVDLGTGHPSDLLNNHQIEDTKVTKTNDLDVAQVSLQCQKSPAVNSGFSQWTRPTEVTERLIIPWMDYFSFISFFTFIALSTGMSPIHMVFLVAIVSLISFRFLVRTAPQK